MPWEPLRSSEDGGPSSVRRPLDVILRHLGAPRASTVRSVFDRWPELVGEGVAARTEPLSLRDGVLAVAVEDPAWATQLRFLEPELLAGIAEIFGPKEVTAIQVRVRPRR